MRRFVERREAASARAFSLVEVVLALGLVSFAVVAIIGVLPVGLSAGHYAQDETRAAQIAQSIVATMASQAPTNFTNIFLPVPSPSPTAIDLSSSNTTGVAPAAFLFANDTGLLSTSNVGATCSVTVITDNFSAISPPMFDPGYANQVTIRIVSPPLANAASTPNSNQSVRDYVRVISRY